MTAAWIREASLASPSAAAGGDDSTASATRERPSSTSATSCSTDVEHALLARDNAPGRRQVAGDHVGVVRLPQAVQHPPARPDRDLLGASELGHQRGHVARATSCCRRRARPPPRPSSGAAAPCGSRPRRAARSFTRVDADDLDQRVGGGVVRDGEHQDVEIGERERRARGRGSRGGLRRPGAGASPARSRRPASSAFLLDGAPERRRDQHLDRARGGHGRIGVSLDPVAAPQVDGGVGDQSSGS